MGGYIDLLTSLPKSKRNVAVRSNGKKKEVIIEAKKFGKSYFDGTREQGYGGYFYDGRWIVVARDIVKYFDLKEDSKILDIGCAKGFLAHDLTNLGMIVSGVDISEYAIKHSAAIKGELIIASAESLPFDDKSFDLVISINTLHNLPREGVIRALKEIERVSRGNSYVVVDAYTSLEEKVHFENWQLTALTHMYTHEWVEFFNDAGYSGYYSWNIMKVD